MKFTDYSTKSTPTGPCQLIKEYEAHEDNGGSLREFILKFDWNSVGEIRKAVWTLMDRAANDEWYCENEKKLTARPASIHARFKRLDRTVKERDTFPDAIAQEIWNGGYSRKKLDEDSKKIFGYPKSAQKFAEAWQLIQMEYNLTDNDMHKLHFFVEQVKAGRSFPNSLRRMLYIWGDQKKTGKTTSASCIVEILNANLGPYQEAAGYTTTLQNEMQIGGFKVPLISACNVCLMDECFFSDMGKMYADFKRFMTSSDGRARLPYGQEFIWHGLPNYVATSNDGLRKFIKDWGDRRYLAIEFKAKPKQELKDFDTIKAIWAEFILNSERTKDWIDWSNEIALIADETGERSERAEEFAQEMKQSLFIDYLMQKSADAEDEGENNKIYLKFFVDYFRQPGIDINKVRGEIEKAVIEVYGPRYSTQKYWRLPDLQKRAQQIRYNQTIEGLGEDFDKFDTSNMPF